MFAEKLDAAVAAQAPVVRGFPNLRARETVKAVVTAIAETINHVGMTEAEQTSFALGFVRGAITVLQAECEDARDVQFSALPALSEILDSFNQRGIRSIRTLAESVCGVTLAPDPVERVACQHCGTFRHTTDAHAEAIARSGGLDLTRRPRDPLTARCDCGSAHQEMTDDFS